MLKEKIKESEGVLSQRQCKWVNKIFSKSGQCYFTGRLWDSQEAAETAVIEQNARAKAKLENKILIRWNFPQGPLKYTDYAWHMQMPVLD